MTRRDVLLLTLAFGVAALLRLYALPSQILIDDEWHGLIWVIDRGWWEVLSRFNPQDNSSPLFNLYRWLLFHTVGWSELPLRLPALAGGLAMVVMLPLLVWREAGSRAALLFAFLLAISPLLVFYSRFSRTYSLVALLGFCILWTLHRWSRSGAPRQGALYVALSAVASWLHLWAVVVSLAPLGVLFLLRVAAGRQGEGLHPSPTARAIAAAGLAIVATLAVVLFPALQQGERLPWGGGHIEPATLANAVLLFSGTAEPVAALVLVGLAALGIGLFWKRQPMLAALIVSTAAGYALALALSRPRAVEEAIVLTRYSIVLVPIGLLCAASGLDCAIARIAPANGRWLGAGALGVLVALGPWRTIYAMPNDFTNHLAYQSSFAPLDWNAPAHASRLHGGALRADELPEFYKRLAAMPDVRSIVEYPFHVTDYNDRLYYYQHFHRKRVLAGYVARPELLGASALENPGSGVLGGLVVDRVLARVPATKARFANMVDVWHPDSVSASGASYLVLHKRLDILRIRPEGLDTIPVRYRSIPVLRARYQGLWGSPVYEDRTLVVFRVPPDGATKPGAGPSEGG